MLTEIMVLGVLIQTTAEGTFRACEDPVGLTPSVGQKSCPQVRSAGGSGPVCVSNSRTALLLRRRPDTDGEL